MTDFTLVGQLPRHLYVWVDTEFTHVKPCGFKRAVWFGLVSFTNRAWGCTVMLQSGAVYRNLPPHAIAFEPGVKSEIELCQRWDCYGERFTTIEYTYLKGLRCCVRAGGKEHDGKYLFTAAPIGDGFSSYPEQAKEFSFICLNNGALTIQPTNNVLFKESSFTTNETMEFPTDLKRQTEVWSCE